jgi:hypoxanthine-DNA glycosylase
MKVHSFEPLVAPDARLLLLGSMPGVASLRRQQYYGHPHNVFWKIMGEVLGFDGAQEYAQRTQSLTRAGVALWDVVSACERPGSLDANIVAASIVPNDFAGFLIRHRGIRRICFNGAVAERLFLRHVLPGLGLDDGVRLLRLPSTSPAHAGMAYARKLEAWRVVGEGCGPA